MVCRVVVTLHCSYGCHVALLARWPLYLGVRRGWRRSVRTYLNQLDGDNVLSPPSRLLVSSSMCAVRAVGGWWWWWLLAKAVRQREQLASMVVVVGMERVLFDC